MKLIFLTLVLAVVQILLPVPRATTLQSTAKDDPQKPVKVAELPPVSVKPGWRDDLALFFAGALVGVGAYGVWMAKRTLKVVERQAVSMRRQTTHLKNSVVQAREAAQAAKRSTDALIASERAWVMVDIVWQPGGHMFDGDSSDEGPSVGIFVNYTCRNVGRMFAQITEKGYVFRKFDDHPPEQPDFTAIERFEDFLSEYLAPNASTEPYKLSGIRCAGKRFSPGVMLLYGRVQYRDVYGEHETKFGYWISPQGVLARLPADTYPEYNKHT